MSSQTIIWENERSHFSLVNSMVVTGNVLKWCDNADITAEDISDETQVILFGFFFNRMIGAGVLNKLQHLEYINFSFDFDQPIIPGSLPESLRFVEFSCSFNQPVDGVFPSKLRGICLNCSFNHPIGRNSLPRSLKYLSFGDDFNQPIDLFGMNELKSISFGSGFDQPAHKIGLPDNLESIVFGDSFNQQIDMSHLLELKYIQFGNAYDRPIVLEFLPVNLLCISASHNKSILKSLNLIRQSIYFHVIVDDDMEEMIDITYPVLKNEHYYNSKYDEIGSVIINGEKYAKLINPKTFCPRMTAKSARK